MEKGKALYVPRGYAHRTINTGDEILTAFYVFDADAGHDYGTMKPKDTAILFVRSMAK